jgi:enoyl-CoA hydratase
VSELRLHRGENGIVTLTFNHPEARNALNWAMQEAFLEAMHGLVGDADVRVLIITGAGDKAFCAGGDLLELANFPTEEDGTRLATIMGDALNLLEDAPFPSIAAINGHAMGGGCEVALACDLRIMDSAAKFGMVQLSLGLTPGWGAGQRLLRLLGYSRALEALLKAQPMTAADAFSLGIINQVADAGVAYSDALNLAGHIATWDGNAVTATKRLLREASPEAERAAFPPLWAAEAHLKAVQQFLEKHT